MRGFPCSFAFCQPARECAADCAGVRRLFPAPRHSGRRGIVAEEKQRLSGLYPAGIPEQKHLPLRSKGQDLSLPHHAAVNCGGLLPSPHTGKGAMMVRSAAHPASAPLPARRTQKTAIPDGAHPLCAETEHGREADALFLRCVPDTEAKEGRKQIRRRGQQKSPAGISACRAFLYFRCRAVRVAVRMPRKRARRHRLRLLLLGFCFGTHVCQQGIIAACLTVSTWITSLSGQQNRISPFCARGGLPP